MNKIEKIALVYFPMNDPGGIITWNREIQKGLNTLGVDTMYFYATPGNSYGCDPNDDIKKERYTMIAGYHLSYSDKNIKDSINILNQFDAVIFTKISPHATQDNLNRPCIENWPLLYQEVKIPKLVVFHDALWFKTNKWSEEVAPFIDICLSAQKKFVDSVEAYPAKCLKYWDYFPIDFESINKLDLTKKEHFGMVATQWIKWKNHHKLLPQLPKIKLPIYLYGAGMEWHYLKKSPEYLAGIGLDLKMTDPKKMESEEAKKGIAGLFIDELLGKQIKSFDFIEALKNVAVIHNPKSPHIMFGNVTYAELQKTYSKAILSIDLSTRGYTNYTHFEPLAYRTISMMELKVLNDPANIIPDDCCMGYDMDSLEWVINKAFVDTPPETEKLLNKLRDNGQKFIQRFDCIEVARRIIVNLQKL